MKAFLSISVQLLLAVLVTVISVLGISSIIELNILEHRETKLLQGRGTLTADRIANSLAYPLWNLNREETEHVVLDEISSADIFRIRVFDEHGELYLGKVRGANGLIGNIGTANADGVPDSHASLYSYSRPISFRNTSIGRVALDVTDASLQSDLRKLRWGIAIKLLLLAVILSVVLYVTLRLLVIRPISTLKSWVEDIPSGSGLLAPRFKRSREINLLAEAFADMSVSLHKKNIDLQKSAKEIRDLYNNAPCGYHSLDANGVFIQINDTELSWLGLTREEVVGKLRFSDVLTAEGRETFARLYSQFLAEGSVHDLEYELVRKDGTTRTVLLSATAARDEAGTYVMSRSTLYDITERVQAERRASDLAYFLSKMREAVIVSDLEYRFIYWNQGAEQLFGFTSEEVMGKNAEELFHDDSGDVLTAIRQIVAEKGEWHGELQASDRHGRKFFIESRWTLVHDAAGQPEAIISIANDVTERKLAQDALRSSEERFARIFNLSPYRMGIIRIKDGMILAVNDCWLREIGFSRGEIVNHPIFELDQWLGDEAMSQVRERLEDAKPFVALEGVLRTKSGERRVALSSGVVVDFDEEPCYLWAANDITERKRAEESLQLSEKRFSIAFNSNPLLATISTLDGGRFLDVNDAFIAISGYSREEALGHTGPELKLWSRPEDRFRLMSKLEQEGKVRGFEAHLLTKRGEERNMLLSIEKIELEGRTCLLHAGIDITERRQTEDQNRKLLHNLGKRVKELTALHDASRLLQQYEADTAIVLDELASLLPQAFQYPEVTAARVRLGETETQTATFAAGLPVLHTDFVTIEGQRGSIEVNYLEELPLEVEGPFLAEERALIDTLADILKSAYDRRQSKLNLEASEERYRTLFETAPNSVRVFGSNLGLIMANQQAAKLFGYESAEEMIGMQARDFVAPADWPRVRETVTEVVGTGGVVSHELTGVRRDGTHFDVESRFTRILDEDGEPRAFLSVSSDITERKLAELALKTSEEQLRALSAKMHSAREEEGTRIAREIHDELGSALTGLKWDIEKMGETLSRPLKGAGIAQVRKRIGAMTHLIELTVETVRRISSELRPVVLDDLGVVAAIQWQAQQFQARTGIKYHWNTTVDTVELTQESATAVFRIFQEILTNVLRHSGATCISVELRSGNGYLELKVRDDGRGISDSEKVNTRSLGLLGMRERALLVGGEVNILGANGEGTTVVVRVPAVDQPVERACLES